MRFEEVVHLDALIELAIQEDFGEAGDVTSQALLQERELPVKARIVAKEVGVICGMDILVNVYQRVAEHLHTSPVQVTPCVSDGEEVQEGQTVAEMQGMAGVITSGERIALNFLGLLSGIASKARVFTQGLQHVRLLDTRKTVPGFRALQKYAVRVGGGMNHRMGLYDMFLIKENHIRGVGSLSEAVRRAKAFRQDLAVEVEVTCLAELTEALATEATIVMLDNFSHADVVQAVQQNQGRKKLEVSGSVNAERLALLDQMGVDYVSMGALTHTMAPLDLSLLFDEAGRS